MLNYPKKGKCFCGAQSKLVLKKLENKYSTFKITIHNVPVYVCPNKHDSVPRKTQTSIDHLLKIAQAENFKRINYVDLY